MALLSNDLKKKIDKLLTKYPVNKKCSAVIPALHIIQDANQNSLTNELMDELAEYLNVRKLDVYEVATFYGMYSLEPTGKHVLNVCTNLSCMLNGAKEVMKYIEEKLGIKKGETTRDGRVTLKEVECQGACCGSPMLEVDKVFHEHLTKEKVDEILAKLK